MAKYSNLLLLSFILLLCLSTKGIAQGSADPKKEVIAILGTGDMGDSFGPRLAELGYPIIYGSRNPDSDKVVALVERTGHGASATTSDEAGKQADIVFLAIPWAPMERVIKSLGDMEGKIIVDLSWPASEVTDDGYFRMTVETSGAEVIQGWIPKARVVKAFGTTGTNVIDNPDDAGGPVTIPIASDDRRAKEVVGRIAAELGMDPVDAGPLRSARNIEAMMELYMIPHTQERDTGWEFYFRRTNYWMCNENTVDEEVAVDRTTSDDGNLADMPQTQGVPKPCP